MRQVKIKRNIKATRTGLRGLAVNIRASSKVLDIYNFGYKKDLDKLIKYSKRKNVNVKNLENRIINLHTYINDFGDLGGRNFKVTKTPDGNLLYTGIAAYRKPRKSKLSQKYFIDEIGSTDATNSTDAPNSNEILNAFNVYGCDTNNILWRAADPNYKDLIIRLRDYIDNNIGVIDAEASDENYFDKLVKNIV